MEREFQCANMIYIRQASRPLIRSNPVKALGISQNAPSSALHGYELGRVGTLTSVLCRKALSTSAPRRQDSSRQPPLASEKAASPFKKQRQSALWEDQQSEDPLYPESHPRLRLPSERISVPDFLKRFASVGAEEWEAVTVCGRVRSMRVVGKNLVFLDIVNEFERLQVMVNKAKCLRDEESKAHKFSLFRHMVEVGDHISITGMPTRTKAGELTIEAHALPELLSPAMEQIPEKLTDPKARMQDRHVDMLVNREAVDVLRLRAEITKHMRDYFHSKRFLEFQTPILAENAGGAVARPFVTRATEFKDKDLALRIAPELWLKRLVVGGVDKVFEIGPSFRNEGVDATHNPEFTTCEFYSAYTNLEDLIKETEELMSSMAQHTQNLVSTQLTSLPNIDLSRFVRPFKQVEFVPALEEALGIRLPKLSSKDALPELLALLKMAGIAVPGEVPSTLAKLLDRLAAMYIEPMSATQPVFITHHPACMSPLAKSFLCPKTYQLVSARAELFYGGRELANMYEEENNPVEQKRKLVQHQNLVNTAEGGVAIKEPAQGTHEAEESKYDADGETAPLDESFVKVLDYGLPPTGGWGCGVDRLVMLFSGANRISDCLSFGTIRNVVGLSSDESKQ